MPGTLPRFKGAIQGKHLGRLPTPAAKKARAIPLRNFLTLPTRPLPTATDWYSQARGSLRSMDGNDSEGDCVAATVMKMLGMNTGNQRGGKELVATAAETSRFYHQVGGPGDNGLIVTDALDYARDKGVTIASQLHKIDGYAAIDPSDRATFDFALQWLCGVHAACSLPNDWYQHAEDTDVWDVTNSFSVGGHSVPITGREGDTYRLATWAREPHVTARALFGGRYFDEFYGVLGHEWYNAQGLDPNLVNVDALRAALDAIRNGGTPDIPPDPNPPTPPVPVPPVPPGPGPGPNPWTWEHTWTLNTFLGQVLVHLGVKLGAEQAAGRGVNWWSLLVDVAALARAIYAKDWTAATTAALAVLADLGIKLAPENREALTGVLRGMGVEGAHLPPRMFEPVGHARESANAV